MSRGPRGALATCGTLLGAVTSRRLDLVSALVLAMVLAAAGATAGGCGSGSNAPDGGAPRDARVGGDAGEGGLSDGSTGDGGDACGGVTCGAFERCVSGSCRAYPACAGDGTCPTGEFCHARRCIPGDVDVDGDGSPASMDCDETSADRSPTLEEICDSIDNDCDTMVDDGDPVQLCEFYPGGGICSGGSCGCPAGTYDFDRTVAGCECTAVPGPSEGQTCAAPVDLGDVADSGQQLMVSGNVLPDDRVVWYRFRGVDTADTSCDAYHVRVLMMDNPGDAFELTVFQGSCDAAPCPESPGAEPISTDFEHFTDFRMDVGGTLTGECPCWAAPAAPMTDVAQCADSTTEYFVRVRRRAGSTVSCAGFTMEISNGVY